MNPIGPEQRHIEHILHIKKILNEHNLIAEEYYLKNDQAALNLAKAFDYEVNYYEEVVESQTNVVTKLNKKKEFLNSMQTRYNQIYDIKYHNFLKRQNQNAKDKAYQAFVRNCFPLVQNH